MTVAERRKILSFMRQERYAVQASVSAANLPQAALVGVAVSDRFEVIFDTLDTTRKTINLRRRATAALVMGPAAADSERTVQLEGPADEPTGSELDRLLTFYFATFPDGRDRRSWPGITYWRVTPTWLRYSDFSQRPPEIIELTASDFA